MASSGEISFRTIFLEAFEYVFLMGEKEGPDATHCYAKLFHSLGEIARPIIDSVSFIIIFSCGTEYSLFDGTLRR